MAYNIVVLMKGRPSYSLNIYIMYDGEDMQPVAAPAVEPVATEDASIEAAPVEETAAAEPTAVAPEQA